MPLALKGPVKVKIKSTEEVFEVEQGDLDIQDAGDDRQMGIEIEYAISADVEGHEIRWSIWEYPVGMENHREGPVFNEEEIEIVEDLKMEIVADDDE